MQPALDLGGERRALLRDRLDALEERRREDVRKDVELEIAGHGASGCVTLAFWYLARAVLCLSRPRPVAPHAPPSSRSMKRDIASITTFGWSRWGEWRQAARRSSSIGPPVCRAMASSCAIVPYSSSNPWTASIGQVMRGRHS